MDALADTGDLAWGKEPRHCNSECYADVALKFFVLSVVQSS
ncbi:MAG: hypothetical protein ACI9NT_002814, partial [Bacteroidia bacterium]